MSRFNVDTDGLRSAAGRCDGISGDITSLGNQLRNVKHSLNNEMGRYNSVLSALDTCFANSRRCSNGVANFGRAGVRIANEYSNTDDRISGNMQLDKFGNVVPNAGHFADSIIPPGPINFTELYWSHFGHLLDNYPLGPHYFTPFLPIGPYSALNYILRDTKTETEDHFKHTFWKNDGTKYKWDSKKKKWVEEKDKKEHSKLKKEYSLEREWDPKKKKWVEAAEKEKRTGFDAVEKEVKIKSWNKSTPDATVWSDSDSLEGKYGKLEYETKALTAEAHADAYVGFLTAGGTVGASATAFTTTSLAQLGNDNLGGYISGTATAGKVGAQAEASAGLFDKYGNINPNVKVGASAEAIAGEISGKVGAKVLGTDVGVSGSLNYGVGAHANIGFSDGKLSFDVGATLGVGASVKLDIDVSGTVNADCDGPKAAWKGVKGLFGF